MNDKERKGYMNEFDFEKQDQDIENNRTEDNDINRYEASPEPIEVEFTEKTPEQNNYEAGESQNTKAADNGYYSYQWNAGSGDNRDKKKKKKNGKAFVSTFLVCMLILLSIIGWTIAASGGLPFLDESTSDNSSKVGATQVDTNISVPETVTTNPPSSDENSDYETLYENISGSCLSVVCSSSSGTSLGSGFVITKDGYIVTNHHVIDGANKIKVLFYNGESYDAQLVGSDSVRDIAVLKIEPEDDLIPIEIGDSSLLKVGQEVVAIGTPYDTALAGTMTTGIISGVNREVNLTDDYGRKTKTMTLIQTNSAINPGNSGGPLINMDGQVIGINTLKIIDEYEGLGFAIPINNAVYVVNQIIAYGKVVDDPEDDFVSANAKLNITVQQASSALDLSSFDFEVPDGAMVASVTRGTAVYKAGLEMYDIITEFNGATITETNDLITELAACKAGQEVTMKVFRINRSATAGEYVTLTFKLDSST